MTSYIDGNNGITNFANIMGEDTFDNLTTDSLSVTNTIYLPSSFTGINLNNTSSISTFELSNLNNSRSNIQQQIDNLSPDLSQNIGYWGSFWNNSDIVAIATNTPYLIPYTASDPSGNGISYNNSSRVQVANSGVYMFILTAQLKSTNSNTGTIQFWLKRNGTNVADTAFKEELKQTTKLVCANWQIALQANDYIQIAWQTDDTSISIEHFASSGNVPQIPSVILTVSQVTYFQSTIAEVTDIKQRITAISYNPNSNTTDISGNISVSGRITRPTYVSPNTNNEYTMKGYVDSQDSYYYGLNQTRFNQVDVSINRIDSSINQINSSISGINSSIGQINNSISGINSSIGQINNNITGISYNSGTDTTIVDNSLNVYGKLRIYVNNGDLVPLNSYIDEQVSIAYGRGSDAMNHANSAQSRADDAYDLADQANTKSDNNSIAIGVITGTTIPAIAASLANLQGQITGLGVSISVLSGRVSVLETKTINQTAVVGVTTFTGQIIIGSTTINPLSIFTPTLDAETSVVTPVISSNTATLTLTPAVQNLQGTTINIGKSTGGSAINIGTDGTLNAVSIGNFTTPVYINNALYTPFNPASFFTQW